MNLILSIFPGIDLLGRGFEAEGFAVVRGPDLLWGGDIRAFHVPVGRFDGVIGGSPCQEFSGARRAPVTGYGVEMLSEFTRVVTEARPYWFLLENVPRVPDILVDGYTVQRFDLNARECGMKQSRLRHFQFGSRLGRVLVPERSEPQGAAEPIAMAIEGRKGDRRSWPDFCELQGLPRDFSLPGMSIAARYAAVGNGVPVPVARVLARAVKAARVLGVGERLCVCGCGRVVEGKKLAALPACRKRMQRKRDFAGVIVPGGVTVGMSQVV
jgi:DNA (cytosine-5)-methyltransferase 1